MRKSGSGSLEKAERFVRDLRIQGADEDGLRNFVARYAGKRWEPIFETLFGFVALKETKQRLAGDPSFQAPISRPDLRDRICESLDLKAQARREARDQRKLAKIEQRGLVSEGLSESEARERSWQMAAAVMDASRTPVQSADDAEAAAQAKRERIKADLAEARSGKYKKKKDPLAPVKLFFSGYLRLLLGSIMLAVFAVWAKSTGLIDLLRAGEIDWMTLGRQADSATNAQGLNPFSIGAAGLLMLLSAFVSGWRMTPFAVVATLVIVFGSGFGIPSVSVVPAWLIALAAGIVIYVPGIIWGETKPSDEF